MLSLDELTDAFAPHVSSLGDLVDFGAVGWGVGHEYPIALECRGECRKLLPDLYLGEFEGGVEWGKVRAPQPHEAEVVKLLQLPVEVDPVLFEYLQDLLGVAVSRHRECGYVCRLRPLEYAFGEVCWTKVREVSHEHDAIVVALEELREVVFSTGYPMEVYGRENFQLPTEVYRWLGALKVFGPLKMVSALLEKFRGRDLAAKILREIRGLDPNRRVKFMHVCGSHELTITKYGLRFLFPDWLEVISGPGCPVCVTSTAEIDEAVELAGQGHLITTFGDMFRVPGTQTSLADAKTEGADIRIVYSVGDAVKIARRNPEREVVHAAVGFETTAPTTAAELLRGRPENFSLLVCHRLIPPAMDFLLASGEVALDGFLCPGHVSTIIGSKPYEPLSKKYGAPQVIAGFEPIDVLLGVWMLLKQLREGKGEVEIEYTRSVSPEGNMVAQEKMREVFKVVDKVWRGFPVVPRSAFQLRREFEEHDARTKFDIKVESEDGFAKGCRCGDVLKGLIYPHECPLFGKACTPEKPQGGCMVTTEGACNITFRYGGSRDR